LEMTMVTNENIEKDIELMRKKGKRKQ